MLIHGFVAHSQVNGPGVRAVDYFQGLRRLRESTHPYSPKLTHHPAG